MPWKLSYLHDYASGLSRIVVSPKFRCEEEFLILDEHTSLLAYNQGRIISGDTTVRAGDWRKPADSYHQCLFLAKILHVTVVFEALSAVENIRREDAGARYIGYYKVDTFLQTTWQNIYTIMEAKHPISMKINSIRRQGRKWDINIWWRFNFIGSRSAYEGCCYKGMEVIRRNLHVVK